jgi:hypothetical protein
LFIALNVAIPGLQEIGMFQRVASCPASAATQAFFAAPKAQIVADISLCVATLSHPFSSQGLTATLWRDFATKKRGNGKRKTGNATFPGFQKPEGLPYPIDLW